jgi:hypothetical protein
MWSKQEISILYQGISVAEKAKLLPGRTEDSIRAKMSKMGLVNRARWTEDEKTLIHKNFGIVSKEEMQNLLPNRTWESISTKASRLRSLGWSIGRYKGRKQ